MCVSNPDRSPMGINRFNAAPTPTGFAEIVSDDFPGTSCGMFLFRANRRCRKDKLTTGVTGYAAWESRHYS
jgi:hypothetical protein